MSFCSKCGNETIDVSALYCQRCGANLENEKTVTIKTAPLQHPKRNIYIKLAVGVLAFLLAVCALWGIISSFRLSVSQSALQLAQTNLTQTQNELTSAKQQLNDVQTELSSTQNTLTQTQSTLSQTKTQLSSTQTELSNTETQLSASKTQLSTTQAQLSTLQSQLSSSNSELTSTKSQLSDTQSQLASSMQQLSDYKKTMQALGINVHSSDTAWTFNGLTWTHNDNAQAVNPTWNQLMTFIAQDKTDQHPYNATSFNCVNYSTTVYNDAETGNIEAAMVTLNLRNSTVGHAVNAFITSDYGLVYVDCTTSDSISRVETGKVYKAVPLGTIQPSQVRNDTWWDALSHYYYLSNDSGGQAIVDFIDIWW